MANFCSHRGKPVTAEWNFCPNCGTKIIHEVPENKPATKAVPLAAAAVTTAAVSTIANNENTIGNIYFFFGLDKINLENFTGMTDINNLAEDVQEKLDLDDLTDYIEVADSISDISDILDGADMIGGFLGLC